MAATGANAIRSRSLKEFVYTTLVRRLLTATALVAAIFAVIAYYHSTDMIDSSVIKVTRSKVDVIRGRFTELMKQPDMVYRHALVDAVTYPPGSRFHIEEGLFAYLLLYSRDRSHIDAFEHEGFVDIDSVKSYASRTSHLYPEDGQFEYHAVRINGKPYLDIQVKFLEKADAPDVYMQALFGVSAEAVAMVRSNTGKTVLYVVAIVLFTAMLLYPVITNLTGRLSELSTSLLDANLETIQVLGATIAKRDSDTDAHNYRVTIYAVQLAEAVGLDGKSMQGLIKGSFLHDIGKIGIRDDILLKPGRLDDKEFGLMQSHVRHGLDIIGRCVWLNDAQAVVGGHHEWYDGSGYPNGAGTEEIPLVARIFALADVFDALTSRRPYKEPFSFEQTMASLEHGRGTHFDPQLLEKFKPSAKSLYDQYTSKDSRELTAQLKQITDRYFHSGIDTLEY